jgi:hypothetical protein
MSEYLKEVLPEGSKVWLVRERVGANANGNSRYHVRILIVNKGLIEDVTGYVARKLDKRLTKGGKISTQSYASEIVSALALSLGYPHNGLEEMVIN